MTTAFRALVMLSLLVGLPAAWVYYGPLPPSAQRVVDRLVVTAKEALQWRPARAPAPAARQSAAAPAAPAWASPASPPANPAAAPSIAERVAPLLATLRQYGVAHYALERWGAGGQLYRFHCDMPLAAGDALTQQFEAVAADPHATVAEVVAEVSSWRSQRQTSLQ